MCADNHAQIGRWHLFSDLNPVSLEIIHSAGTLSHSGGAAFGASCLSATKTYNFFIENADLAKLPFGSKVEIGFRLSNEIPFRVLGLSNGNGRVYIDQKLEETSFKLLGLNIQLFDNSGYLGATIGAYKWLFPLNGASSALDALVDRCGFPVD